MVEWLTLLPRAWEVSDSNLGRETGYLTVRFRYIRQPLQTKAGIVP